MIAFGALLERLTFTPGRSAKIALLNRYFATEPDPGRGYGLAVISGTLSFAAAKPALIRTLGAQCTDPVLFAWSYDYVGDLAETVALLWRGIPTGAPPTLGEVVAALRETPKAALPSLLGGWLDRMDASTRLALLKVVTGGLRAGASARLAILALAEWGGVAPGAVEEVWHGLAPPYSALFAWLEGRAGRPEPAGRATFRPLMLAHPLAQADIGRLAASEYFAEWKWDGIRVELVATETERRIYSRGAEDVSASFPEILESLGAPAVLDGELLAGSNQKILSFNALQQRLNRKNPTRKLREDCPVMVRLFDIMEDGSEDLRAFPLLARRARLERLYAEQLPQRMDLSPLIPFESITELAVLRANARAADSEGLMLKRADSPYVAGRPKGLWWKWKRAPLSVDAVMMYAQRGHGKRSSFYSDFTFGLWAEDGALLPIGKAYSGYTDAELLFLDRWVRNHTVARFGPVREVEKLLVLEVAFDAVAPSSRHRSGVALRFPRIARIRTDKPAAEADRLETLLARVTPRDSSVPEAPA
ncbi:MAG: cisplatin damage response ATP-dependent DNA ligase [Acetobacteraceae bacterium]